jgi:hypothetical protein
VIYFDLSTKETPHSAIYLRTKSETAMRKNKEQVRISLLRKSLQGAGDRGMNIEEMLNQLNDDLAEYAIPPIAKRSLEGTLRKMREEMGMQIFVRQLEKQHRYVWEGMSEDSEYYPTENDRETLPILFSTLNTHAGLPAILWLKDRMVEDYGFTDNEMDNESYFSTAQPDIFKLEEVLSLCGKLIRCMRQGRLVTFTYKKTDQNKPEKQHTVAPVHIRMYENRYYLYALLRGSDGKLKPKMTLFAIDQIRKHELTVVPPEEDEFDHALAMKQVQLKNYFNHVIGVWHPEDQAPEIVRLRLTGVGKSYVKHRKLHPTQRIIHTDDESVTVEITVYVSDELNYLLGRFRGMCERV